jgi:hypothetical protein
MFCASAYWIRVYARNFIVTPVQFLLAPHTYVYERYIWKRVPGSHLASFSRAFVVNLWVCCGSWSLELCQDCGYTPALVVASCFYVCIYAPTIDIISVSFFLSFPSLIYLLLSALNSYESLRSRGHTVAYLVAALCYKPESRGFDSRRGH